jgi:membrane-associated protease RseP (regulator of RpoE activity)
MEEGVMNDLTLFFAAVVAIWVIILLTHRRLSLAKRGFTLSPGVLMWRTSRGLGVIDRLSERFRRWWIAYGTAAVLLGIVLMFLVLGGILTNAVLFILQPAQAAPGVRFILPGTAPGLTVAVWLMAVGVVLIVHEFSHGFLLRSQGLRTKSVGLLLFLFIPGAFVEPDERELKRSRPDKRARVFAAGPIANVIFSVLFLLVLLAAVSPREGVYVWAVAENSPLAAENILGARILYLDNIPVGSIDDVGVFKDNLRSGGRREFELVTDRGRFTAEMVTAENGDNLLPFVAAQASPGADYLHPFNLALLAYGIILGDPIFHPYLYSYAVPSFAVDLLKWLFALNFGVGLFNLLPAKPLDGGYVLEAILEKKISRRRATRISYAMSLVVLVLIIINLLPVVV